MQKVFIIDYKRTAIGSFMGLHFKKTAVQLATELISKSVNPEFKNKIEQVYFGNVYSTGCGQNLARQIALNSGINCPAITVNRVCGSAMISIIEATKSIKLGDINCALVGGTESMSNVPHATNLRFGKKFGDIKFKDIMLNDGLTDVYTGKHMGIITAELSDKLNINLEEQNNYAKLSYQRARNNLKNLKKEIFDDNIDEEVNKIPDLNKLDTLKPVFGNSITAGNASKLSDGASYLILASEKFIIENNIKPIAEIIDYNMMTGNPEEFSLIPVNSVKKILDKNKLSVQEIDAFEVNEAFSLVPINFSKTLNIDFDKINLYGGAVAMGHPLGCSGSRIVCTLLNILHNEHKKTGIATICNGGGGATSILIKI